MFIRQSKNAFIRSWNAMVYIENQVNHISKTFTGKQKSFILSLSRQPQDIETIKKKLSDQNIHFETEELYRFIKRLESLWFVVTADLEKELDNKDIEFSYADIEQIERNFAAEQENINIDSKDTPWLRSLQLEVTSLCNEKCIHCYIPTDKKVDGSIMPLEQVKVIIDEFAAMSGLRITLSGGEVFIHKQILEILEYCRRKDLMIFIQSNITLFDDHILKFIKNLRVFNIQVSLYSMDEFIHDEITKLKGSWAKTINNIEKLVANNIPIMISCPILKQNYQGYRELLQYTQKLNIFCYIDYVLLAQSDLRTNNLDTRMTLEQTGQLIEDVIDFNPSFRKKIDIITTETDLETIAFAQRFNKCDILRNNICILVNGNAYPCPGWQKMIVGNILKQSLREIWTNSPKVIELRNIKKCDFKKCAACDLTNYCDMCMVYNYNENGGNIYNVCERFCDNANLLKNKIKQKYELIQKHGN